MPPLPICALLAAKPGGGGIAAVAAAVVKWISIGSIPVAIRRFLVWHSHPNAAPAEQTVGPSALSFMLGWGCVLLVCMLVFSLLKSSRLAPNTLGLRVSLPKAHTSDDQGELAAGWEMTSGGEESQPQRVLARVRSKTKEQMLPRERATKERRESAGSMDVTKKRSKQEAEPVATEQPKSMGNARMMESAKQETQEKPQRRRTSETFQRQEAQERSRVSQPSETDVVSELGYETDGMSEPPDETDVTSAGAKESVGLREGGKKRGVAFQEVDYAQSKEELLDGVVPTQFIPPANQNTFKRTCSFQRRAQTAPSGAVPRGVVPPPSTRAQSREFVPMTPKLSLQDEAALNSRSTSPTKSNWWLRIAESIIPSTGSSPTGLSAGALSPVSVDRAIVSPREKHGPTGRRRSKVIPSTRAPMTKQLSWLRRQENAIVPFDEDGTDHGIINLEPRVVAENDDMMSNASPASLRSAESFRSGTSTGSNSLNPFEAGLRKIWSWNANRSVHPQLSE